MQSKRLRREIADQAARLLAAGRESDFTTAKRRAARILGVRFTAQDFPSNREIRDAWERIDAIGESGRLVVEPHRMRVAALRVMRVLRRFSPRLVGPAAEGDVRTGAETVLDVEAERLQDVSVALAAAGVAGEFADGAPREPPGPRLGALLVRDEYDMKVRVFSPGASSGGGLSLDALQRELEVRSPNLEAELDGMDAVEDRFEVLEDLLRGLEDVRGRGVEEAERDPLQHALRMFELARRERDYDEEFLTACLVHNVGRLTRSPEPLRESGKLLDRLVTRRTQSLVRGLELTFRDPPPSDAEIAAAAGAENVEDVRLLAALERKARRGGAPPEITIESAIERLRALDRGDSWDATPHEADGAGGG